jgi:hypothetical protein
LFASKRNFGARISHSPIGHAGRWLEPEERLMSLEYMDDDDIVDAINDESIADEDLVSREGWRIICMVRGRNFSAIDAEAWQSLCGRRGYLLYRRNPRGF